AQHSAGGAHLDALRRASMVANRAAGLQVFVAACLLAPAACHRRAPETRPMLEPRAAAPPSGPVVGPAESIQLTSRDSALRPEQVAAWFEPQRAALSACARKLVLEQSPYTDEPRINRDEFLRLGYAVVGAAAPVEVELRFD